MFFLDLTLALTCISQVTLKTLLNPCFSFLNNNNNDDDDVMWLLQGFNNCKMPRTVPSMW